MIIHYCKKTAPSALALRSRLTQEGYNGPDINFGFVTQVEALNKPQAIERASNKKLALETMRDNEVPTPSLYYPDDLIPTWGDSLLVVGRPDKHSKGRGFWLCHNQAELMKALRGTRRKAAASHFLEYIEGAREFRVHVMKDGREGMEDKYRTIKISEKINEDIDVTTRNHDNGTVFNYTEIDRRDRTKLRKAARATVKVLGLDFGAVDILFKDGNVYVLEVNTAPRLTDDTSDTLDVYVKCFMRYYNR